MFDACALIAYLNDEVGAKVVEDLLALATQERAQCFVAAVNVCELFYDCLRRDAATAHQLVDDIYRLPITVVEVLDRQFAAPPADDMAWNHAPIYLPVTGANSLTVRPPSTSEICGRRGC